MERDLTQKLSKMVDDGATHEGRTTPKQDEHLKPSIFVRVPKESLIRIWSRQFRFI